MIIHSPQKKEGHRSLTTPSITLKHSVLSLLPTTTLWHTTMIQLSKLKNI